MAHDAHLTSNAPPLSDAELRAWLRLMLTPGIGHTTARQLLSQLGPPELIFAHSQAQLLRVVNEGLARRLAQAPDELEAHYARTQDWLAAAPERALITLGDAGYPEALLETADPPLWLFAQGQRQALRSSRVLAVVGSRNPSPQGRANAEQFAHHLAQAQVTVVSGLALGVDGAAHEGALSGGGQTIAVVGTGLDRVYPKAHHALAHQIAAQGVLLSEYPLGTPPLAANFPKRNRIISGLAQGTLVVEATLKSGSLITARLASEQGREVFAIPGSIHAPQSKGCHALIKQGAKLVESAQDVVEELRWPATDPAPRSRPEANGLKPEPPADPAQAHPLLAAMGHDPVGLDALQARTGQSSAELQAQLLTLELAGQVARLPGAQFQRLVAG
jgi:DNA processing protein